MARALSEIDRLIEEGLGLYGEGDLDGALLLWDRVLVIDPHNAQANSYVDYVRMNYELLTSDNNTEDSGPFGIASDEPEYQIEISPGDAAEPAAPLFMDDREHGWGISDDSAAGPLPQPSALTLELEADEPPLAGDPGTFEVAKPGEAEEVGFDDATREYPGGAGRPTTALLGYDQPAPEPADFNEVTPGFGSVEDFQTPQGAFTSQRTDIRRRELGFVQPREEAERPAAPSPAPALAPPELAAQPPGPPELKMKLRTPSPGASSPSMPLPVIAPPTPVPAPPGAGPQRAATADDGDDPMAGLELDLPPPASDLASAYASLELELPPVPGPRATEDLGPRAETRRTGIGELDSPAPDLVGSLPTPRLPGTTRPLPSKTRPPAFDPISGLSGTAAAGGKLGAAIAAASVTTSVTTSVATGAATDPGEDRPTRDLTLEPTEPAIKSSAAPTQELPYVMQLDPRLAVHGDPQAPTTTADFADKPTNQISARGLAPRPDSSLITAPTRELGLRELALRPDRPPSRAATEDEITGQVDVLKLPRIRGNGVPELAGMDPIDARSTDILEEVDRGAPTSETREERTRRRITALLDRAAAWSRDADYDRAVTAVDLALSEDPNSALAQKLIHRNREAIMNAFQAFLGDLQRAPSLARPLHELGSAPISPRAAFLLSRVDGTLSLDEILDVSGMPRMEAYRYLCQLFLRGILR